MSAGETIDEMSFIIKNYTPSQICRGYSVFSRVLFVNGTIRKVIDEFS